MMSKIFSVFIKGQTYANIFYLLIAFVLGNIYFTVLITGISIGLGLLVTLIGIPILLGTILLSRLLGKFEIFMSNYFLKTSINYPSNEKTENFWNNLKNILKDGFTWRSLAYLFLKFPIGIIVFVITITLLSLSFGFMSTPLAYLFLEGNMYYGGIFTEKLSFLDTALFSIVIGFFGIIFLIGSLHLINAMTSVFKELNKTLLGIPTESS